MVDDAVLVVFDVVELDVVEVADVDLDVISVVRDVVLMGCELDGDGGCGFGTGA